MDLNLSSRLIYKHKTKKNDFLFHFFELRKIVNSLIYNANTKTMINNNKFCSHNLLISYLNFLFIHQLFNLSRKY